MRVVAAGATGFIGTPLWAELAAAGHTVQLLSRAPERYTQPLGQGVSLVGWDPRRLDGGWVDVVGRADAVVNLAGESIASGRWTSARKEALRRSRLTATGTLVQAIARAPVATRPRSLVNASAIGYYGDRDDETLTEESPPGDDFLARLCIEWEAAAHEAESLGVRVVTLRTGVVLGKGGGALPLMALPFRLFLGGPVGSGRQWVSWVHLDDVVGIVRHALENEDVRGPVNATSSAPVRQRDFARAIGEALGRPSWAPVPAFVLRVVLGEMADGLLLPSQRVLPTAALSSGYQIKHPDLLAALRSAL